MKKITCIFLFLIICLLSLSSCGQSQVQNQEEFDVKIGENGNWIINGVDTNIKARGEDGRETVFRVNDGVLEWKYVSEDDWKELIILKEESVEEEYTKGLILNEVTGYGYMVIGYDGEEEEIIIPNTYRGVDVFKIADNAFEASNIKKITIGRNVLEIGDYAFYDSNNLKEVIFKEDSKLETLGDGVFYNCDNLESINIPSTLKKLGSCAFFLNDNLICEYDDIYGVKYLGNKENPYLILYDSVGSSITECVVNENCKFINDYAFTYCSKLASVTIPEGVMSIGDSAFYSCSILKSLYIPSTVCYIGDATLNCSSSIEEIIVAESNPYYDSRENCNAIIESKTNTLIYGCKTTVIPDTVEVIKDKAYYGNSQVESIYIPASVKEIGIYVFSMCTNLAQIEVDSNNKVFTSRDSSGNNCNVIIKKGSYTQTLLYGGANPDGTLVIPNGVTSIEVEAFRGRLKLVEITLPKSLSSIKNNAFDYCQNLKVINNASKLVLTPKSSEHGGIAYYATTINII